MKTFYNLIDFEYEFRRLRENFWIWLASIMPQNLRYWIIVKEACRTRDSYPADATADEMLKRLRLES